MISLPNAGRLEIVNWMCQYPFVWTLASSRNRATATSYVFFFSSLFEFSEKKLSTSLIKSAFGWYSSSEFVLIKIVKKLQFCSVYNINKNQRNCRYMNINFLKMSGSGSGNWTLGIGPPPVWFVSLKNSNGANLKFRYYIK